RVTAGQHEVEIDGIVVEHGERVGRTECREQVRRGRVHGREGRGVGGRGRPADGIDRVEMDTPFLEAIQRNADDVAGVHDGGAAAEVRAVELDAVPVDGAEAARLRRRVVAV